jgi:hypothetical protein
MTDYSLAANFIEQFEGYTPEAKWDVNAYRLGYGSDTEGPDQVKVTKGMTTTRERAFANLEARIPQFENVIIKQVSQKAWDALPSQAQAGLLSIGYNYGDLPAGVAYAVQKGESLALIASSVEARAGDNNGVNKARRLKEAEYIASATPAAPPPSPQAPPAAPAGPKPVDVSSVSGIQQALNILMPSTDPLVTDGVYGGVTVARMKAFQHEHGIKETGDTSFMSVLAVYEALQKAGVPVVAPA